MWVYNYKFDADGYLQNFKARLVAGGDLENTTEETYAATLVGQVFRAVYGYKIRLYDIVAAYTNADLIQPRIAYLPDGNQFLVTKALYGLLESALLWQHHLQATLIDTGLFPVSGVNFLFKNNRLIILFYGDDIIVIHHKCDSFAADKFEEKLMTKYQTMPLG